jgi:hypothetical protein
MTEELRILTVRQPWAWAIIDSGTKDVENRIRNIAGAYRGPIAIHAGLSFDDDALTSPPLKAAFDSYRAGRGWSHEYRGVILGVVDLVDVHHANDCWAYAGESPCSSWAEDGDVHHLVLAHRRPLSEPIPYKGALGLRRLDAETAERVWGGLA